MKLITLKKHIVYALVLCYFSFSVQSQTSPPPEPRFKTFQTGQAFTSITSDANKNVWAGTTSQGLFFLNQTVQNSTFSTQSLGTAPVIGGLRMQSMAKDKSGNIWIGHGGTNFSNGSGGVERVNVNTLEVQHLSPDRDALGFQFFQRDGIATLNAQQVAVDPNNKVWIAHRYHDLTVLGPPSSSYILTPGTFSTRDAAATGPFESFNTWNDRNGLQIGGLPYPAYTLNPTPTQSTGTRTCNAISADRGFVYVSVTGYNAQGATANTHVYMQPRLLKYTNTTVPQLEGEYTSQNANFSISGGIFHGVYANGSRGVWATTPYAGKGFSVLKNGTWLNVVHPDIIPPNTTFTKGAIWGDSQGRVYLGTNNGLIVYNGFGDVASRFSYTLFTKVPYQSSRSVHDPNMLSNNITAGCIESNTTENYSWIATPDGIMRSNLSLGDVIVYHVNDKEQPMKEKINNTENYETLTALISNHIGSNLSEFENMPSFAVDGTKSSVIRIKTKEATAFYSTDPIYKVEIRKDPEDQSPLPGDPSSTEFIERYGKLTLKPIADYDGQPQIQDLKFVDYIFQHPEYIKGDDFVQNKHYTQYNLFVFKKRQQQTDSIAFRHPIKFSLPPVLFGHGVWSEVKSVKSFESYFKTRGYTDYETIRAWRVDGTRPENPFEADADIIPKYIKDLIKKAIDGKVSAGKVNVIVHSRGGLYTRAYIEGLSSNPKNKYNDDINALVTLNTPHFGSQAANLILDQRIIIPSVIYPTLNSNIDFQSLVNLDIITFQSTQPLRLGNIFEKFGPASNDKPGRYGTKNLTVVNDNLSQIDRNETRFIGELNEPSNASKMSGIPIHAVATTFNLCQVDPIFCNNLFGTPTAPIKIPRIASWALIISKIADFALNNVPAGITALLANVYQGPNDGIVPVESMEAGLRNINPQYVSSFVGEQIAHIDTKGFPNTSGVTENLGVQGTVFGKLKQKLKDDNSSFSKTGIIPTNLTYNFLPNFNGLANRSAQDINTKKIVIDPNSFNPPLAEGQLSTFNIYQENLDKILVVIDYENDKDGIYILEKNSNLTFANTFSFTTPTGNYGKVTITAYGISAGRLACEHNVTPGIQLPQGLTLQSIRFEDDKVSMAENSTYKFNLLGTFSDNVERKINYYPGINYEISNPDYISRTDSETINSLSQGQSVLKATVGSLNTLTDFSVTKNTALQGTIVTDYFSNFQTVGPVTLKWNTFWEYRSKKFILESSTDNINFTQINEQLGSGTNYNPASYSFIDNTTENVIYYKLRLLNLDDTEVYNQTIQVNRSALSINEAKLNTNKLVLSPNPLTENTGTLSVYSALNDDNASLNIYNISGKLIYTKQCSILSNTEQKITFEMPSGASNGIYLVQIKTKEFSKTVKLVLEQ